MSQQTLVLELGPTAGRELEARLSRGDFEFRSVPHATFSAKGEGVVVTYYRSGKLVVQGAHVEAFALQHLPEGAAPRAPSAKPAEGGDPDVATVGSDETGKGDFLGPLVVVAVRLEPGDATALREAGVTDSKLLSDARARELGAALQARYATHVVRLDPEDYNAAHARTKNLNVMLANAHAQAIRAVAESGDRVVVDRFGPEKRMQDELADLDCTLEQFPRAESRVPAVAAASVVARCVFLEALDELSDEHAVRLAKGAGSPADRAAREFVRLHGREALGRVAKLHFKNAARV